MNTSLPTVQICCLNMCFISMILQFFFVKLASLSLVFSHLSFFFHFGASIIVQSWINHFSTVNHISARINWVIVKILSWLQLLVNSFIRKNYYCNNDNVKLQQLFPNDIIQIIILFYKYTINQIMLFGGRDSNNTKSDNIWICDINNDHIIKNLSVHKPVSHACTDICLTYKGQTYCKKLAHKTMTGKLMVHMWKKINLPLP